MLNFFSSFEQRSIQIGYHQTQVVRSALSTGGRGKTCTEKVEKQILADFTPLYEQWTEGALSDQAFFKLYEVAAKKWLKYYHIAFAPYLK